jgi:hypothetical protein
MGPRDYDVASEIGEDVGEEEISRNDRVHIGDRLEVRSFRNSLFRIKRDVVRCLKWMDLGLSPCLASPLG